MLSRLKEYIHKCAATILWKLILTKKYLLIIPINEVLRRETSEVFCKNGVLKNFAKFTKQHLCQIFFFDKVVGLILQVLGTQVLDTSMHDYRVFQIPY